MFILYITSRYSPFNILNSKPCQRQYELLPSLGVRHLSSVYFSHFNLLLWKLSALLMVGIDVKPTITWSLLGSSWPWSYSSWIYNYICNQCLSPLMLWVRISIRAKCTTLCDKVCQWLATGLWFSPGPPVSSTNQTDRHDITEILLNVVLSTIKQTSKINDGSPTF